MRRKSPADRLVARYLADLDRRLASLPNDRRRQTVDEVALHIAVGRSALDHEDPLAVEALLERVGDPRAIAMEAGAYEFESRPSRRADRLVPWLLLLGGLILGVGWLLGAVLLWASPTWRTRDKLLGTFVFPGGLAFSFALLSLPASGRSCFSSAPPGQRIVMHCTTSALVLPFPVGILVLIVAVVAPILTVVHLERVQRRNKVNKWVPASL